MGWSPEMGLVINQNDWNPTKGKPIPGNVWKSAKDQIEFDRFRSEQAKQQRQSRFEKNKHEALVFIDWTALPYPIQCGASQQIKIEGAVKLQKENLRDFMFSFPQEVQNVYFHYIGDISREYSYFYFHKDLNFILGEDPSPSVDIEKAGLRRRQFITAYPFVTNTFLANEFQRRIDDGYPMLPALAQRLDTQEYIVRFLAGDFANKDAIRRYIGTPRSLFLLEGMPASWLPHLYDVDRSVWHYLDILLLQLPTSGMVLHAPLSLQINNRPKKKNELADIEFARYLGSTLKPTKTDGLQWLAVNAEDTRHLFDMASNMATEMVLPAMVRINSQAYINDYHIITLQNAILAMGVPKLKKALRVHLENNVHDARLGFALEEGYVSPNDGLWKELTPPVVINYKTVRFLRSQAELTHEGKQLSHCVGNYGGQCEDRTSCIMSIGEWNKSKNSPTWNPSSTVEIQMTPDGNFIKRQHYGYRNGMPTQQDRDILIQWFHSIANKDLLTDKSAIKYSKGQDYADQDDLPIVLGEAWKTPEAHVHRWDRWRRILGVKSPCFGDWLLSLPPEFMNLYSTDPKLIEIAVDMDEEMMIAHQINILDADEEIEPEEVIFKM
jgi:hypothetical protein